MSHLQPGDAIVFEEYVSPHTGLRKDADPQCRQVVRLTELSRTEDPLSEPGHSLWRVEWHPDDALERPFHVSVRQGLRTLKRVSVVRGNMLLADHGETIVETGVRLLSARTTQLDRRAVLSEPNLLFRTDYDHERARRLSARTALGQSHAATRPCVRLIELGAPTLDASSPAAADHNGTHDSVSGIAGGTVWQPAASLLGQDPYAPTFVVEMTDSRHAHLRFGDGKNGLRPRDDVAYQAVYRFGGGQAGNLGHDAIGHVVSTEQAILGVRNPLPSMGGRDPQTNHDLRESPRLATRRRASCLRPDDFVARAAEHEEVRQAYADLRWTGSWWSVVLTVHRKLGMKVDSAFRDELIEFLEPVRVAGVEVDVRGPELVPLEVRMLVFSHLPRQNSAIGRQLRELLGVQRQAHGRGGFFHPDQLSLGQRLHPSQLVSLAMGVKGVRSVRVMLFRRWTADANAPVLPEPIQLGPTELPLVENDLGAPERGTVVVDLDPVIS